MNDIKKNLFGECSVDEICLGFVRSATGFRCLHCGEEFETGLVYKVGETLMLAERAVGDHVEKAHGGAFAALLALGPEASGLPEIQERVLRLVHEGKSDKEIALALGGKSESTIRNHRFNIRKRAAEARIFLALVGLLEREAPTASGERFIDYPASLPTRDERSMVTETEAAAIEARCLDSRGAILFWPKKQKEKLVVLKRVAEVFERGRRYTEPETNALLMPLYDDYVTIRRYLIEYRFLDRMADGSAYWKT
jgi:DNA-binding CsgD family transcriptional regulator